MLLAFVSCFEDDTNYSYKPVSDIEIKNIENLYVKVLYLGENLEITPEINTEYTDLAYEWYLWKPSKEEYNGPEYDPDYKSEMISTERNLNHPVDEIGEAGTYTVMLKVISKSNDYAKSFTTRLDVTTEVSRGFYILKETADGNSELDLHYRDGEPVMANLFTAKEYGPMEGKPLSLAVHFAHGYLDMIENKPKNCRSISVATDQGKIAFYNSENLNLTLDNTSVTYSGLAENEIPYMSFANGYCNHLLTSKGVTVNYVTTMGPSTGKFATHSNKGGSTFAFGYGDDAYFWDQDNEKISYVNSMWLGEEGPNGAYEEGEFTTAGMECLACGHNETSIPAKGYFILKEKESDNQFMYVIDLSKVKPMDKVVINSDTKLAKATAYAFNSHNAEYIYFVYGNKLYKYSLAEKKEDATPIALEGITAGETITQLSYQWLNDGDYSFTHLIVGTQEGNKYRVRMYDLTASIPQKLVRTIEGEGIFKSVMYMSPTASSQGNMPPHIY